MSTTKYAIKWTEVKNIQMLFILFKCWPSAVHLWLLTSVNIWCSWEIKNFTKQGAEEVQKWIIYNPYATSHLGERLQEPVMHFRKPRVLFIICSLKCNWPFFVFLEYFHNLSYNSGSVTSIPQNLIILWNSWID